MSQITKDDVSQRNDSETPRTETGKIRGICSGPVLYELIDKDGRTSDTVFSSLVAAEDYARRLFPDQEQDPDRTGRGWDVRVVGADR